MTDVLRTRRYRKVTSYKLDLSQMLGELLGLLLKQSIIYYKNQQDNYSHFKTSFYITKIAIIIVILFLCIFKYIV